MPLRGRDLGLGSVSEGQQNPKLLGRDGRKQSRDSGHGVRRRRFRGLKGTELTFSSLNPAAFGSAGRRYQAGSRRPNLPGGRLRPGAMVPSPRSKGGAEDPGGQGWARRPPTPSSPAFLLGLLGFPRLSPTTDEVIKVYPCTQNRRGLDFLFFFFDVKYSPNILWMLTIEK